MENERDLIQLVKNGDREAFRKLVEQNKRNVYYLAFDITKNKEDAEDITQEVFLKVFRSINRFRGDSKLSTWIYTITINTCYSLKKKKSISEMRTEENIEEVINDSEDKTALTDSNPEKMTEAGFIQKNIEHAMKKLSKNEKAVFVLRNFKELPFGEIVEIMKMRPGTVRSLNFRALKKLQKELAFYKEKI